MKAFKCDSCGQYFDLDENTSDEDRGIFDVKVGEWEMRGAIGRFLPPVSEESPEHGKEKDTYHIDKIQALDGSDVPEGLKGILGAIVGHVHKGNEGKIVRADLCDPCHKAILVQLLEEAIKPEEEIIEEKDH